MSRRPPSKLWTISIEPDDDPGYVPRARIVEFGEPFDGRSILIAFHDDSEGEPVFVSFPASIASSVAAAIMGMASELILNRRV